MKRWTRTIVLSFCSLLAFSVTAVAENKIHVVDMQKVIAESIAGKAARTELENEAKKRTAKLDIVKAELAKMQEDIEKQKAVLSKNSLDEKIESFQNKEKDAKRMLEDAQMELGKKEQEKMEALIKKVDAVIADLAKEDELSLVLQKAPGLVLYASQGSDVTDKVIAMLNKNSTGM